MDGMQFRQRVRRRFETSERQGTLWFFALVVCTSYVSNSFAAHAFLMSSRGRKRHFGKDKEELETDGTTLIHGRGRDSQHSLHLPFEALSTEDSTQQSSTPATSPLSHSITRLSTRAPFPHISHRNGAVVSVVHDSAEPAHEQDSLLAERGIRNDTLKSVESSTDESTTIKTTKKKASQTRIQGPAAEASATRRSIWRRRNARSAQEGIRREKLPQLSTLLAKAGSLSNQNNPRYIARTITGLIIALAEEVDDLEVEVKARRETPFHEKQVDQMRISFSRLRFKPLRIGGLANATVDETNESSPIDCAEEAFRQIDADNSGFLDREEIIEALLWAAGAPSKTSDEEIIRNLAEDLMDLYDFNGDGLVDRWEYQSMVEDMAALRELNNGSEAPTEAEPEIVKETNDGFLSGIKHFFRKGSQSDESSDVDTISPSAIPESESEVVASSSEQPYAAAKNATSARNIKTIMDNEDSAEVLQSMAKSLGSITFSDLKMDLRRLFFGAIPFVKRITPGGPLILEPFTVTVTGSFDREDIMKSSLLEAGLSRLIALVLRRRVRSFRDFVDLAVLFGRDWKLTSATAPMTEVAELSNVEFDSQNRLIMTGRARIRTRPGAPTIEQAFKVRAKVGARRGGRFIRLVEPELAFVWECPKELEKNIIATCRYFNWDIPPKPEPVYSFFPIYSPFKVDDNDGFDLGEDNCLREFYIEDGALRFELSAVLRPGRFLGNHYIAFTLPMRTFLITLDRVKAGIRSARKAKKALRQKKRLRAKLKEAARALAEPTTAPSNNDGKPRFKQRRKSPRSFFSRFVDGYMRADEEEPYRSLKMTSSIRDFFGNQSPDRMRASSADNQKDFDRPKDENKTG